MGVLPNRLRISLILGSVLVGLFLFAWAVSSLLNYALTRSMSQYVPDGQKSYKEFRATIKSFPYSTSEDRKNQIVVNYLGLRVGMTQKQVAVLIGDPDYSQPIVGPKGFNAHWRGNDWSYRIFMREDGVNMNDPTIQVFFDTHGLLVWGVPSGISGLSEIGECCNKTGRQ